MLIYTVYCHFVPRADVPYWKHDRAIYRLLCERLFCFEYPVLPEWFLTKNKPLIIRVDDNVAAEQVKSKVRNCYVENVLRGMWWKKAEDYTDLSCGGI